MLESLLNKVAGFQACIFTPTQVFSCEYWVIFINTNFEKDLPMVDSVSCKNFYRAAESQIKMKYKEKLILFTLNRYYNMA